MTFPIGRLVAGPSLDAEVRYDFNDHEATAPRRMTSDFTLGVPSLETAYDAVSQVYGPRNPSFGHTVQGEKSDALEAIATLSRELLRPSNWFLFQLDTDTRPVWLRLYPSGPEALSLEQVYVETQSGDPLWALPDMWEVRANFTAEAFGYGERIVLGPYTVTQDAAGDNPMRIDLPVIKGDAPTALRVSITPDEDDDAASSGSEWLIGAVASTEPIDDPVIPIGTGDSWTATDATASVNAKYLDGSYRRVLASTTGRLFGLLPQLAQGRYMVLLRGAFIGNINPFIVALKRNSYGNPNPTPSDFDVSLARVAVTPEAGVDDFQGWLGLGEIAAPLGNQLPEDVTSLVAQAAVMIEAAVPTSAEGALDAVKLIPVDGPTIVSATMLRTTFGNGAYAALNYCGTWDGDTETCWVTDPSDVVVDSRPTLAGAFPLADPAATYNALFVIAATNYVSTGDFNPTITSVGAESVVTVSYHPRLLHLDGRP